MKLDIGGYAKTVRESAETQIDALTALTVAAGVTSRIELGTGIVLAFARNPITANDVHLVSGGRCCSASARRSGHISPSGLHHPRPPAGPC